MLSIHQLYYAFGKKVVFDNLNLQIQKGNINCICGDNGKGKSTLINIITKYYTNFSGEILYDNINIKDINKSEWRSKYSICHQNPYLYHDTVINNITLGNPYSDNVNNLINRFDFYNFICENKQRVVDQNLNLSGGQQQLISIIRCLSAKRDIIILDEPTSNLDNSRKDILIHILNELKNNYLIIVISHDKDIINNSKIHTLM
ncbi:ABC transporter ATP-binding protein [Staphylococcus felis]|uniref:ATP-binding cassette domain-containing protein n=3 Tax=Staphylococcus felis TaxID=46127 RepID=UPI000E274F0D|nr:ABC transporter ATP-binding protein [Staphylococcus felis]REH90937.1 ABC transporter ATP-binding protein [Staphylococcus felis]REI29073.1 ABC transporter ATP-binding protein [Staphylococcus felis]